VSELIRGRIIHLEEERLKHTMTRQELEEASDLDNVRDDSAFDGHHHLGAPQAPVSFKQMEEGNTSNRAFGGFRKKFTKFINNFVLANKIPFPDGVTRLEPPETDQVGHYIMFNQQYFWNLLITNHHNRSRSTAISK